MRSLPKYSVGILLQEPELEPDSVALSVPLPAEVPVADAPEVAVVVAAAVVPAVVPAVLESVALVVPSSPQATRRVGRSRAEVRAAMRILGPYHQGGSTCFERECLHSNIDVKIPSCA